MLKFYKNLCKFFENKRGNKKCVEIIEQLHGKVPLKWQFDRKNPYKICQFYKKRHNRKVLAFVSFQIKLNWKFNWIKNKFIIIFRPKTTNHHQMKWNEIQAKYVNEILVEKFPLNDWYWFWYDNNNILPQKPKHEKNTRTFPFTLATLLQSHNNFFQSCFFLRSFSSIFQGR